MRHSLGISHTLVISCLEAHRQNQNAWVGGLPSDGHEPSDLGLVPSASGSRSEQNWTRPAHRYNDTIHARDGHRAGQRANAWADGFPQNPGAGRCSSPNVRAVFAGGGI